MIDEIDRISKIKKERYRMKMGKAKYGGQTQRKYFKLKDGEQAFRILPPLGDLADEGRWSVFHSVHYGYKSTDGKQKPFLSCEVRSRKEKGAIEIRDAAKDRITALKAKYDAAKDSNNTAILDQLEPLVGAKGMYNLDNNHYMNVVDAQGNIGILKIRHKAKLALEKEIKDLNAQGIDPLSPENGRYFVFSRTGTGRDTTFGVKVLKEKISIDAATAKSLGINAGGVVERDIVHVLDDETIKRLSAEAGELNKIFKQFTAEEVKQIVEGSNLKTGVSAVLDKLFGKAQSASQAEDTSYEDGPEEEEEAPAPTAAPATAASAAAPAAASSAPAAAPAATQSAPKAAVKTTASLIEEDSDQEFLRKLELGIL